MDHLSTTESYILHRDMTIEPSKVVSGTGIRYHLESGKTIIDATGGPSVSVLGHSQPEVAQTITEQLTKIQYVYSGAPFTSEPAEELARLLLEDRPGGLSKAIFVNSGSEATDTAIKLATQYWREKGETQRTYVISRKQSYHGNTIGALCVSGHTSRREFYQDWLSNNVVFVDPCYAFRAKHTSETDEAYLSRLRQQVEDTFQALGAHRVSAFIAEPLSGTVLGCATAVPGYFKMIREICDKYGALLILDEIICGMGKTGTMHAWEQEEIRGPDIQTIGKALGAGFVPLSGVLLHENISQTLAAGSAMLAHGHTFQAHPLACAAALAVQKVIKRDNILANVKTQGQTLERLLHTKIANLPFVADIRGRGLFWGVEFLFDVENKVPFSPAERFCGKVVDAAMDLGLNILGNLGQTGDYHVDHVMLTPPYIIQEEDLVEIVDLLRQAIERVAALYTSS